jgi:hypothetical protein
MGMRKTCYNFDNPFRQEADMKSYLLCVLFFIATPAWAQSVAQAVQTYEHWQAEYTSAKAEVNAAGQQVTDKQVAVKQALAAVEAAQRKKDKALRVFEAAQNLEKADPSYSSGREKAAYAAAVDELHRAEVALQRAQKALREAGAAAQKTRSAASSAASEINRAAAQVGEARLKKLRAELGSLKSVVKTGRHHCGTDETRGQCETLAKQNALQKASEEGAAIHVRTDSVVNVVSGSKPALRETIRRSVSGLIKSYKTLDKGWTQEGTAYHKIEAQVQGQVPDVVKQGLMPPLADGSVAEIPQISEMPSFWKDGISSTFKHEKSGIVFIKIPGKDRLWVSETEVTQAQWKAVMSDNPSHFKGDDRPVENMTWYQATEFASKLGNDYRLLTEEEWEYAARAGGSGTYGLGKDGKEIKDDNLGDYAWYTANSSSETHTVKDKFPNKFGLYDMHGNVWEWTCSAYDKDENGADGCISNNHAKSNALRVIRGGSWNYNAERLAASNRYYNRPDRDFDLLGLRVARIF